MPKEEEEESSSDGWSVDEMPASIFDDPDAKAGETAEAIPETDAGKKDESESTNEKKMGTADIHNPLDPVKKPAGHLRWR